MIEMNEYKVVLRQYADDSYETQTMVIAASSAADAVEQSLDEFADNWELKDVVRI